MSAPYKLNNPRRTEYSRAINHTAIPDRFCKFCKNLLTRTYYGKKINSKGIVYAHWETMHRFSTKKFCGNECKWKYQTGENNPRYRGIMPKCIDCGKKIAYKSGVDGKCTAQKRCKKCFYKWAKQTNYFSNTPQLKKIKERMKKLKGIQPENLKPFAFKKGQTAWNKGL